MAELGWNPAICEWAVYALKVYHCVLVILCMLNALSGPICEWAISALSVHCMFLLSLGMSGPICEWAVSASSLH